MVCCADLWNNVPLDLLEGTPNPDTATSDKLGAIISSAWGVKAELRADSAGNKVYATHGTVRDKYLTQP